MLAAAKAEQALLAIVGLSWLLGLWSFVLPEPGWLAYAVPAPLVVLVALWAGFLGPRRRWRRTGERLGFRAIAQGGTYPAFAGTHKGRDVLLGVRLHDPTRFQHRRRMRRTQAIAVSLRGAVPRVEGRIDKRGRPVPGLVPVHPKGGVHAPAGAPAEVRAALEDLRRLRVPAYLAAPRQGDKGPVLHLGTRNEAIGPAQARPLVSALVRLAGALEAWAAGDPAVAAAPPQPDRGQG